MSTSSFHGFLVVDKPGGLTSRDVVNRAQAWFPPGTRIGHTGTLDPLATGVLVLCIGVATRLAEYVQQMEKTYRATLLLGARSTTDDADGRIENVAVEHPPPHAQVAAYLHKFVGDIEQVPPAHSAARISGRRAYDLARQGKNVPLGPRRVHIAALDLLAYAYPRLEIEVRCGKGTYIRSLARDLGERLGCGALVEQLRRTRVGPFLAAKALSLETDRATALSALLPLPAAVAELPAIMLGPGQIHRLRQGQAVRLINLRFASGSEAGEIEVAVFDEASALIAVAVVDGKNRSLWPKKVLSDMRSTGA
jgi:tRNA pseudouridine55 synthase